MCTYMCIFVHICKILLDSTCPYRMSECINGMEWNGIDANPGMELNAMNVYICIYIYVFIYIYLHIYIIIYVI